MLKSLLTIALLQLSIFSYSQLPTLEWLNSSENVSGELLASDMNGDIYMTGSFYGSNDFDPGPGSVILTSMGGSSNADNFLCKFDSNGHFLWVKQWSFESIDGGFYELMPDSSANIYMMGKFGGTEDFDPGTNVFNLTTTSSDAIFLIKLDPSGNFLAGKKLMEGSLIYNFSLHVMANGETTIGGNYGNAATFISGETKTAWGKDHFLIDLDSGLNYQWLKSWGGQFTDYFHDHDRDAQGNIYFAGSFIGSTDVDPGIDTLLYPTNGNEDAILSKFNPHGELIWAKVIGGASGDRALEIEVDYLGNLSVLGYFGSDTMDFDPSSNQYILTDGGKQFTAKYTNNCEFLWVITDAPLDLTVPGTTRSIDDFLVDNYGNIYTSGTFRGTMDFDPGVDTVTLNSNGDMSYYIRKLNPSGELSYVFELGRSGYYIGNNPLCFGLDHSFYTFGIFDQSIDFQPGTGVFNVTPPASTALQYVLKMNDCSNGSIENASECNSYTWAANNTVYSNSGIYSHTLSNDEGCDSIVILDLTINPNTSVTENNLTLSAEVSGAAYQWINCDLGNSPIPGATNQSFSPSVNGNYAVIITQNGCSDTSSCTSIFSLHLSESVKGTDWSIYPNPAYESVKLVSEEPLENYSIQVLSLNGDIVPVNRIGNNSAKTIEMNISQLPDGVYLVQVTSEKGNNYLKFIKY
nr:T9SS type A sorting domain-containing protein [uncultured Fluviicola sp.]